MRSSAIVLLAACGGPPAAPVDAPPADATPDAAAPAPTITATVDSTRFVTREHMLAAGEMQISGEPLAEIMGRDLGGYSRDLLPTNLYTDPVTNATWVDLPGFSTAVESYEYSKQPMNGLAFEYGAGTSLAHAPLVGGEANLIARVQQFAAGANAAGKWVFPAGTFPANNVVGDVNPTGAGDPADNPLGWPGMWPTAHVFASFDPAVDPTHAFDLQCSIASDDNPNLSTTTPELCGDYECSAVSLHLRDRAAQIDPTITPGADGFTTWKYGLWTINYLQVMHDGANQALDHVDDPSTVGTTGGDAFLGSSDIEGFQAAMFVLEADARADDWLAHLTTTDGTTLSGFASLSEALAYDHGAPLRWFPAQIAVTETDDGSHFPAPSYAIAASQPPALDLIGMAMGYAEFYALTDTTNRDVGGAQPALVYFDGDPFAVDDGVADGEPTLHDRALAIMRVAVVDLDRMFDPASADATTAAYAVIGLRTVLRALDGQLELYSNNTPDEAIAHTPLDAAPLHFPSDPTLTFTARTRQLLRIYADVMFARAATDTGLDDDAAEVRGLFAAYLATGDVKYRDRAIAVFDRMDAMHYDAGARMYTDGGDTVTYTPVRFALIQSALRDMYELVATRPGSDRAPVLESRLARLNKLVLNGWDDRDDDAHFGGLQECVNVVDSLPRGGLQMAERALTGELGRLSDDTGSGVTTSDRDGDCVPEIDDAHLPAALADSVTFRIQR